TRRDLFHQRRECRDNPLSRLLGLRGNRNGTCMRQQNRGNKQHAPRKKSSFHERLCPKRESDVRPQSALFSNSMLDKAQRVLPRHAAAKATAQQARALSTATAGVN